MLLLRLLPADVVDGGAACSHQRRTLRLRVSANQQQQLVVNGNV